MRLRTKLLLPILSISLCFVLFTYSIWLPKYINDIEARAYQDTKAHLRTAAEGLVPLLLENQLANTYENLDALLEQNSNWKHLKLSDNYGRRLYPIAEPDRTNYPASVIELSQEVGFSQPPLAHLQLAVDFSALKKQSFELKRDFITAVLVALFLLIVSISLVFEFVIKRRLSTLEEASKQLSKGNYNTPITTVTNDEIGQLSQSFIAMRDALSASYTQLKMEMENHKTTTAELLGEKERATFDATHDALTGLINRREFEARLNQAIDEAKAHRGVHALLYLDLDQFKIVNDTCGHIAGDALLQELNVRLAEHVRSQDTLARLGGDEFGVLLKYCTLEHANNAANNIRKAVEEFRFIWKGDVFSISVSIGLTAIDDKSGDMSNVLSNADSACYLAKDHGRNRIQVYQPSDKLVQNRRDEMQWVTRLVRAMQDDEFELYCQPIYRIKDIPNKPDHYEILLRLKEENGEIIMPGAFIPAAERYNLITTLDRWVLKKLLDILPKIPSEQALHISVNLSGPSLGDNELLELLEEHYPAIAKSGHQLCFEITETAAIRSLSTARHFIERLQGFNFMFSLDDFGTGMSSFSYLKSLPVDFLKIDGTFVRDISVDEIDLAMVRSINEIGQTMGMQTIAEFVESEEILKELAAIKVDFAQGHYFGEAEPLAKYINLNDAT